MTLDKKSPVFGPWRELTISEKVVLKLLIEVSAPTVFGEVNKRLNQVGLCVTVGSIDEATDNS